ncbi:hypothetical protein THAOC_32695 [Thalassiosira oceanica]|uniref:Uncharacterized protein n=1 Tax=Thalassiosira oceanica TaxID=159749 RepID=K0R8M9_THAOC|nr:hypothetical protein THAOC_32695 [Thalassiosira oceanica]|eukprot:EJK48499.1 hypothetical protein THAOC_32695 [Thalassiosira oceanica]
MQIFSVIVFIYAAALALMPTALSKDDVSCLRLSDSLLSTNLNNFLPTASKPSHEGAYGYFDTIRGESARSGACVRRGMPVRGGEHLAEAKKDRASSFFYACFPSIHSSRAKSRTKMGHFESLRQIIFVGFDAKSDEAKRLDKEMSSGGLLLMMSDTISTMSSRATRRG